MDSHPQFGPILDAFASFLIVVRLVAPDVLALQPVVSDLLLHETDIVLENDLVARSDHLDDYGLQLVSNVENNGLVPDRTRAHSEFGFGHRLVLEHFHLGVGVFI